MEVLRLDALNSTGREVATSFGLRATPSYILFDGEGTELWRSVGRINRQAVLQALDITVPIP